MAEAADKAANRQQRAAGTHGEASAAPASSWASAGAVQGAAREFTSRAKVQVWEQGRAPHKCSFLWANTKLSWNTHQWIWLLLKVSFPPKAIAVTAMTKTKNAGNLQNWSKAEDAGNALFIQALWFIWQLFVLSFPSLITYHQVWPRYVSQCCWTPTHKAWQPCYLPEHFCSCSHSVDQRMFKPPNTHTKTHDSNTAFTHCRVLENPAAH